MPDNVDKLFEIMQAKGAASDRGKFRKVFLTPGNKGYKIRKDIYDGLRADGIIDSPTYEDFRRKLRLGGTPTVNKYRQQMFNSVDPNKSRASELTHRAIGQAVRATNNVRKPVVAKVVNRKGKPTGENFAITPAKTVEDLDREYAQETTKNWENELHDQMADADKDAAKISDMFKSFIGSTDEVGSVWGNMTRGGGIAGTPHSVTTNNGILENTEARQILAAGDYNRKRRELLQLEKDSRLSKDTSFLGGVKEAYNDIKNGEFSKAGKDLVYGAGFDDHSFWRGMYDAAKDTGFLTGGASDLINAGSLLATKQDLDNGVHTEAGDMLMQQAVKNSDAQSQYGDNQGWMYTGGVITTNMAPFMVQIGSAGFSKGMSNTIGKVVQGAASKVALGTMEKATGMAGAHIANYIGKVTGLTTKAFGKAIQYGIVGAAQANTVGLGNVANDVVNRYTGQVYQDEQGNYKFGTFDSDGKLVHEGGEDFLTSFVKGEAAQTIEFATELAGGGIDAAGTALKNFVTKGGKKIINKYNMENVSKVIDFLLNNKVSKHAIYLKAGADRTLGNVELNSIVGESLEEELGIIANTVFTGDNKISDLWDEKQQSQIWGGMLLSIGLMKGAVAPFHAYNAKQYYSYKHKLNKADVNLSQLLGKEKWDELRNKIDATTNKDMPELINKINRDVALGKNRQPVREYIQNLLIMRGYDIGNMLAAKKAVEDKGKGVSVKNMEKNQAYQQGRDAYGYDTHEIQLDQADKQKTLAQLLGITEQQLSTMSDEELDNLSGRDDNLYKAIYDYQLSTIRYQGVADNAQDQVDLAAQKAAQAVDMYTDKSRNTIRNATIKAAGGLEDYGVYIINGNIATHDDGSIDVGNSDDMILFYDPTTNTVEHADATRFAELGSEENADEVRNQAVADAKENAIKEITGIIDGVVEVGTQFKTIDADGTEHTYEVLADNGDGTAMITIDGNIPTQLVKGENVNVPVSFEELQKMKDASDQQRLQAAKAQREQMEKERAEQQMQAQTTLAENPAQENNTQSAPIEDNLTILSDIIREDGKVQMVDVSDKDGNNLFPEAKDVFYIQGNKMRTKFAYIDANGELKKQNFPTGLVKIKTRGEVSVDDYKKYRSMILSAESSAVPESSMIEDNSGAIEGDRGGIEGDRGGIEVNDELPPVPDNVTINGDGTYSVDGAVQGGENTTAPSEQTEQTPAMTLEDGTIVPMLEDGNPDFSKLTADQTAELYDTQFGEDADSVISGWVSEAKKALDKANNMTVKGKNFVEQKAAKEAKEKAIADAQAAYDSAIAIRDAYNSRQLAKIEDDADGRKNLIEKARRKFARLKSAVKDDAEAVSQLYKDVVGSLLHRLYDGTGIDVTDTIPLTAEEYVASNLGAHSLNYEGTETSKGVKQETGLSREDFAKTQLLAADGKGTTIDDLVHSLWENRPSNLESLDTQDIRNALIGVLTSGFKASEARNYIENLRIAQAENILEEQKKAAANAAFAKEQTAPAEEQTETAPESEQINDEENEQTNAPEQNKFPDKLKEGSKAIEVPEDATNENPLGLQLSEDKVPFEIEGEKSGETYNIKDSEDRQRLINDNKVDDKDILDIDMPKHVHKAIKELCKKMGLKVQFLYMGARSNGWIENGTMYLALDTEKATQFVFGHEMTHAIKQKNPEAYKELVKVAMAVTTRKKFEEDLAKVYQNYYGISGYNNVDDFVEEVVADNLGKIINDFDLAQKFSLRLNHPVLATILHAIQKIKSLLYGDFYKSVDALERIVEKAYVDTAKGEVTNSETGEDVSFSLRLKPEPKKKGIGYKVFVLKDGKLYPPMVANPNGAATPVGVWLDADAAPIAGESKTGRPQVKQGGKGTQGGSGKLAYRPGWHLGVVPYAIQFNRKDADGNKTLFPKNFVFAEVEYAADVDYQEEARQEGINPSGKYQHSLAGLKHLPTDGYYMYRTNPNPETDPWVITGAMKVNRILTRAEQAELVKNAGREPQQIQEGDIVTDDVVNSINQEIADAPKFSLKVYHGSGADFTEFDFDHMGEGAGSQVFGWGGYVTSSKKIGKSYATLMDNDPSRAYYHIQRSNGTRFAKKYPTLESFLHGDKQIAMNDKFTEQEKIDFYNEMKKLAEPYHNLYEVDIPDDNGSNYLDWDKPLSKKQQDAIREGLEHLGVGIKTLESKGQSLERTGENVYNSTLYIGLTGTEYDLPERTKGISKFLSSVGFTGIKYKAGRNFGGAKKGDTNYVIFKPEDMKITEHTKFSIKTYHGSQASFDKFDHSFMGSGEGTQAYGWGTYVSEVEGIAKAYAKQNAARHGMQREYKIAQIHLNHAKYEYDKVQRAYDNSKVYIDSLKEDLQNYRESIARRKEKVAYFAQNNMPEAVDKLLKQIKRTEDTIKVTENDINMRTNDLEGWKPKLEEVKKKYEEEQKKFDAIPKPQIERNLYSVDIPDDTGENYIGWDEKMTPRMRDIRKEILEDNGYKLVDSDGTRDYFEDRDGKEYDLFKEKYKTGGTFYEELAQLLHSQKLASLALKEYGFDGVKVIAERNTGGNKEGKMNYVIFDENNAQITSHTKFSLKDPFKMSDNEKKERGDRLIKTPAVDVASGVIQKTPELSARKAAEKWWNENIEQPLVFNTEIGDVVIDDKSIKDSLAHKYNQAKLDSITSLPAGFGGSVYLGTISDFVRTRDNVQNHYFAYPINYDGQRNYVFCRAMQDTNKNRLYVHEVFVADKINEGNTLQTAASKPHGGIALYKEILANVLSAAKIDNSSETTKENGEKVDSEGIKFSLKDEKIKSIAEKFGVNEDDVAMYANAVERGSTADAARARANIKRYLLQANEDKISSFKDIIKYTKPINEALKENFGDLDAMIEERRKQVEAERNAMEAARKRAQEEEEKRQKHLAELSLIPTDELDKRYMDAIANNDESTAREMLDESARRNGYGDVGSDYQGQGAWAAPSNPQYESDEARRADIENSPDVNLEDIALGYNLQPDDYFDNPRAYMNNTAYGLESAHVIKNALDAIKNGEKDVKVKVYRAVPTSVKEGKLRNGDWVTPSKKYAEMHGDNRLDGKYRIIEDEVPANQLWWDGNDANEFGFDDGKEYRYKNAKNNRKLNDLITYDNKGNVIPPSKRFNSRKSDIRFSLAGERGAAAADKAEERTARMDNLSVARKMEEEKKDAKAIKMATGWERGADGKWRYEMPDAMIKETMDVGGGHIVKRYEDDMLWNGGKLSKVIDAPELFKAYPQLKDVRIETDAIMNDMPSNGEYNAKTNTITIHADELKYMNSILNHEIQHAIQSIEGFDRGGSPRLVRGEIKKRLAEVTKQIRQLRAEGKEDEAKAIVEKNRGLYNAYQANDDYNSYKSLAGEVEARNVQERMNMSPEERRKTLAESTEDVARKDQIFLGVGDVSFSLRGSTPYDKQMEEWMEKNHLEKGAVPMEKPIMKEGENIFDYANRMVEWTRNQNLWKTAPKKTGFQDALAKWKADNGLSPDAYPPVRPHRENYSTEIGYAEDLEEYNKKKELWKSAPKPKDFDLSVDLEDMNKQLRNIRRAVLNQKNYDQRTVKAVSDLVRKMLNIGWGDGLSRGKVGNLLSAAKNATGANDVKKYLDKAMGILAENYLNRLSTAYDNLINTRGARADQSGVIKMGSLDAKGQAFISEYKKAINMDDKSLNTYIANIEEDSAKNEDNVEMNDYRLAGIQAAIMYKQQIGGNDADIAELKRQIGELKNKKDATKEDKDLLKSLEKKLFENKFDRITMYENLLNNIQRMVKESKGRAKEFREEIAEHKNEILHRANLDLEGVDSTYYDTTTAKKKLVNNDLQRAVFSSTYTFEQFLKFFGKKAANGEGYLYNYFTKLNQDALDEEQLYNEMNRNALDEKTKELFGKEKFMKLVGIDGKGMKEMDVEVTDYSNKETGKRTIHLKQGQMLYIYLVNKETDGEMKLRAMGITEEDVAAIEENLDPRVKAMGEWLQDEYLPECQRRYQATHTKYFGAPMKEVENYFPLAINNRARNVKEDVNQDSDAMSQLAGTSTGAIVTRRVNVIPLDIENADAFEVAFNHLQEMEEWSAMLPFRQDINTLLSYTHFRNQVQNMSSVAYGSGKTLWDEFKQTAQIAAGTYKPKVNAGMMDSRIAAAMGGIAVAKISGRLWTAIKQSQSATVFLPECDFTRFVKNGVNPYGSWKWAKENIPDFRKRVENMTYGDVKLRQYLDELEKWHDWTKTISKIGMAPNILVDGITCAVGARSVYETEVNRLTKLGYPKEKAEEKAYYKAVAVYNKTQQSSGGMYLSPMQVDRTYASAALSLFKNANYAYGRMQIEACRGLARTYDLWGGKHKTTLIESMTRQIMEEDGLDENTARAIAKATYNRTFRQSIGRLINFATLVPVSWALYKVLPYLLFGDDDDKKTDMIEEAVLKGFATSLSDNYVIPFASNILNAGLKVEDGKPTFDPEVFRYQNLYINPATSDLANIYSMIGNQKWYSVANKLGMLGVQSLIGFNPETVGALYQAFAEADYDNGNTAKEWQIGILKAISAPEESIRELYMDELGLKSGDKDAMKKFMSLAGLDADDINKVPLAELEKRYAERQINRDNLLSQVFMDAEDFNGYVDKYQKSFEKKIKDKMDKWDEYDKKKTDEFFDTTSDPKLKDMIEKKRTKDANAAADEQIANEGLNQEKKGKEPSEEAYDAVKMSIDVAEDNAISTYNKVLNKRYAALNDEYNNQTDAMKYIFMSKHPNFKAYKDLKSEYTTYGKKMKELKEKLVSADGYDAKQTILKQIRAERDKFYELQSKVR